MPTNPPNHVEMINTGDGWKILLDGYDLAPHVSHWQIVADDPSGDPDLVVRIPTDGIIMRAEGEAPTGYRFVQRAGDAEPRLVKVDAPHGGAR